MEATVIGSTEHNSQSLGAQNASPDQIDAVRDGDRTEEQFEELARTVRELRSANESLKHSNEDLQCRLEVLE